MLWTQEIVVGLCELKGAGWPFEAAWRRVLEVHPPSGRDRGPERPTLFAAADHGDESVVEFMHRACGDAWHGRRPALAHLHVLLDHLDDEMTVSGRPVTRARSRGRARASAVA